MNANKKYARDLDAEENFAECKSKIRSLTFYTTKTSVLVMQVEESLNMRYFGTELQRANLIPTVSNAHCTFCIPVAEYEALISLCDRSTPEYKKFRSGIIVDQVVHFLFDESTARSLYQYALANCPGAAKHIEQTMREAGDDVPF